mgnify:CR=1 FL=1
MIGNKLGKKVQAALEFLMSYGWAILIMVVVIAALAYFGVLSPDALFSDKCILPAGITCLDHKVESYQVILVLKNNKGETMTITNITISSNNQECFDNESITLYNNDKVVFIIEQCNFGIPGGRFNGKINITYALEDKLAHKIAGTLRAKVVEGSPVSSQSVCQNAQTNGLCDGLDIVYGSGYQVACCGEHGVCCV